MFFGNSNNDYKILLFNLRSFPEFKQKVYDKINRWFSHV